MVVDPLKIGFAAEISFCPCGVARGYFFEIFRRRKYPRGNHIFFAENIHVITLLDEKTQVRQKSKGQYWVSEPVTFMTMHFYLYILGVT